MEKEGKEANANTCKDVRNGGKGPGRRMRIHLQPAAERTFQRSEVADQAVSSATHLYSYTAARVCIAKPCEMTDETALWSFVGIMVDFGAVGV